MVGAALALQPVLVGDDVVVAAASASLRQRVAKHPPLPQLLHPRPASARLLAVAQSTSRLDSTATVEQAYVQVGCRLFALVTRL